MVIRGFFVRLMVASVLLGCAGSAAVVRADGAAASGDEPLELRILDVGAMTHGNPHFIPDRGPFGPVPDQVNDETNPLFGGEGEEATRPVGGIDDLVELVRTQSAPGAFEREGSSLSALGSDRLLLRAGKSVCDAAGAALAQLERDVLGVVTLDVLALSGDTSSASREGGTSGAIARGDLRVIGAARTSAFSGQRVTALSGGFRAYLADYSVEVSQGAATVVPLVSVQPDGLCVDVTPRIVGDAVTIDFRAWLALIGATLPKATGEGDAFESISVDGQQAAASLLRLRLGEWTLLPASQTVSFAVRATLRAAALAGPTPSLPAVASSGSSGPLVHLAFPVRDLTSPVPNRRGAPATLLPSNYTAPEPPELREPLPVLFGDTLVELMKQGADPAGWEREGSAIESHDGTLRVTGSDAQVRGIGAILAELRRRFTRTYRAKAVVISLPTASFPELAMGLDDGADLLKDGGAALLSRAGARIEESAALRLGPRGRMGVVGGRLHRYVGDYGVAIAEKAAIGNPTMFSAMEGTSFDLDVAPAAGGTALRCDVRFDRSTWRGEHQVNTRHGAIDLPDLGLQRVRGSCVVPLGATRLLSVGVEGDRVVLVTLTVNEG